MYIKEIKLKNFRNYEEKELFFNKKVNLILGRNGQGKTNLIESIYISSIGKSFRTNRDNEMIKFGKDFAKISAEVIKENNETLVEIILNKDLKKFIKVDGIKIRKISELLNNVLVVIFSPEDLRIVKDEPEKRRKFIDKELCQIKPSYYENLYNYKKVLVQRNSYLKEEKIDTSVLDIWDTQLAFFGSHVIIQREIFSKKLKQISSVIHSNITGNKEKLDVKYCPNITFNEEIKEQERIFYNILKKSFNNDIRQRTTSRGPHKDDFDFYINNINVRNFGSQGQQRTTALSLKLAEIDIIKKETGEKPILLLDDVMSELDLERQEFLLKSLSEVQLFLTTTELPEKLINKFTDCKIFNVEKGEITE